MVTRIVSDDKIQITILILMWGALSKPVLFCFKQCYTLCILLTLVTRLTQRFIVYIAFWINGIMGFKENKVGWRTGWTGWIVWMDSIDGCPESWRTWIQFLGRARMAARSQVAATTLRACDTVHTCLRQVFLADDLGDLGDPLDFLFILVT